MPVVLLPALMVEPAGLSMGMQYVNVLRGIMEHIVKRVSIMINTIQSHCDAVILYMFAHN